MGNTVQPHASVPDQSVGKLPTNLVGDLADRHLVGERAHDELLERAQLLGLGDVLEQRKGVLDPALPVAEGIDPGADPDFLAVLGIDEVWSETASSSAIRARRSASAVMSRTNTT